MAAPPAESTDAGTQSPATSGGTRARRIVLALALAFAFAGFSSWVRVHFTLAEKEFDRTSADGLLRSDPGLLYYITERIVEAGGGVPDDFRADPRIRHPETADIPAMFTVGQEFLVAWAYRFFGGDVPLHVVALYVMAIVAGLGAACLFGLTYELTRGVLWATLATSIVVIMPFSYRLANYLRDIAAFLTFASDRLPFPFDPSRSSALRAPDPPFEAEGSASQRRPPGSLAGRR